MWKFILIVFDRRLIHEYTSEVAISTLQNRSSPQTEVIIALISLLIWFSIGLILAYWVKKDMKKRNLEGPIVFFLILLTSFIGFIIYIIVSRGEIGTLENDISFSEIDGSIKREEEAEFHDEIEEISEEEAEDVIESILEDIKIQINQ